MMIPRLQFSVVFSIFFAPLVSAYSFIFTSNPQQCSTLSMQITGSGVPPYSVLIVPYGVTPLSNNVEVRSVISQQFSGDASTVSFQLNYPASSQFIAVASDASGFGTGGTSGIMTVSNSNSSNCFNADQTVNPDFFYSISPDQVVQCNASRLWWDPSTTQGNVNFQGIIPGGESFSIPAGTLTNVNGMGTGFDWTPNVLAGTTVLLVAGDQRGLGTGGSAQFDVSIGPNQCITNTSPTSTAGPPAGSIVPPTASSINSPSSHKTIGGGTISTKELAIIIGGATGGLIAMVALGFLVIILRKRNALDLDRERTVNLLDDYADSEPPTGRRPLPFPDEHSETYHVTSPTIPSLYSHSRSSSMNQPLLDPSSPYSMTGFAVPSDVFRTASLGRQPGATTLSDVPATSDADLGLDLDSSTMDRSLSLPKPALRVLRPTNIILHEDAGLLDGVPQGTHTTELEMTELPPAYTDIR